MPVRKRKVKRFVVDVNSLISIFINQETDWLLNYIVRNRIEIFVDKNLIDELTRVLEYSKIKKLLPLNSILYINFVRLISTQIISTPFHVQCPDPDDDYLFDLALSSNSKLLVTGENALLKWKDSPVETISLSDFKNLF